jgi:hypothetical protein
MKLAGFRSAGARYRKLLFLATLLAASAAYADQLYIVPVFATRILGASGGSSAVVHVFNPGSAPATVTVTEIFAGGGILDCPLAPANQIIDPLESRDDIRPFCGANVVAAFTISSDRPLVISNDIETTGRGHVEHQSVRVLTDWLPANRQVVLPRVPLASEATDRVNLFLVNPNPFSITVTVRTPQPSLDLAFDVPGRTLVVRSLPEIFVECVAPPCIGFGDLLVQANGIFYAGASWLDSDDPVYRDPILADE